MQRRLARALVRRYPPPWRERYQEEVLGLIEDSPVRLGDLGELVRGLLVERARALIEDADHPTRTAMLLSSLQPAFVIGFMAGAWGLGLVLRAWWSVIPAPAEIGSWLLPGFLVGFMIAKCATLYRRRERLRAVLPMFPAWAGLTLLPVLFVGIVLATWSNWAGWYIPSELPGFHFLIQALVYGQAGAELSGAFWPGRLILQAIGRLAAAEDQVRWMQLWVDGCHTMAAQGVPSPLAEAEAQVELHSRERENALAQLQQLGYRARFEQPA